jgi:DNA polymerase
VTCNRLVSSRHAAEKESLADGARPDRADASLDDLRKASQKCRGCDIWQRATQAVFGEGAPGAEVMLVGEQPGNREDLEGRPFVGPAGKLLDTALAEAEIDRKHVYVTNVVKHFNSTTRGKLRIHKKPNAEEIAACRPWLEAEIARVGPKVIVCLGATAAQALISRDFRVSRQRGEMMKSPLAPLITATVPPHRSCAPPTTNPDTPKCASLSRISKRLHAISLHRH